MGKLVAASLFTLGLLSTFVFGIVMAILVYIQSADVYVAIGITIFVNVVLWLVGPWITDHINSWFYHVQYLSPVEVEARYPNIHQTILTVSNYYKFKYPKIGVIPDRNPTAFTYGTARYNSRIVFTQGIVEFLTPAEVNAVIAHELGHIVNRDFLVMMIASTLVQILYEIYAVLIRSRGKKAGSAKLIALVSYILYIASTYIVYFLSRTREYMADAFSARLCPPQDLANALIKIAYGIVSVEDTDSAKRLLQSTRQLGIIDVKNAKHIGVTSFVTKNDPSAIAEVMVFDTVSPWAKLIELSSTHPLTGKRIQKLSELSKAYDKPFGYDIASAEQRLLVDRHKLYENFFFGLIVSAAPVLLTGVSIYFMNLPLILTALGLGLLFQILYKYPLGHATDTTILDEMRNPYASPLRGKAIRLSGTVIGRGIPGYIFSEDMMYQDRTGLTFLDYNSLFGLVGNMFFAFGKLKTLFGVSSSAEGWFFRDMSSHVTLKQLKTPTETIHSHPIFWSLLGPIFLFIAAGTIAYLSIQ